MPGVMTTTLPIECKPNDYKNMGLETNTSKDVEKGDYGILELEYL